MKKSVLFFCLFLIVLLASTNFEPDSNNRIFPIDSEKVDIESDKTTTDNSLNISEEIDCNTDTNDDDYTLVL